MNKLTRSKLDRDGKLILVLFFEKTICSVANTRNVRYIADVLEVGEKVYFRIRPFFKDFIRECSRYFEFIIAGNFECENMDNFAKGLGVTAQYFKGRILAKSDYHNRKATLIAMIPEDARDRVLYMSHFESDYISDIPWLPISPYRFFRHEKFVNPAIKQFSRENDYQIVELVDEDTELKDMHNYLARIHDESFRRSPGEFIPDKFIEIVERCRKRINRRNRPKYVIPSKSETIAKCEELTKERLQQENKLILLVDLDYTILQSCGDMLASRVTGAHKLHCGLFTRFRPGVREFLREMSEKYEMIVVTMGTCSYAADIVDILDPQKTLFKNRIFSKNDIAAEENKEEVLAYFAEDVRDRIVIIDDTPGVWENTPIIRVPKYSYWYADYAAFDEDVTIRLIQYEQDNKEKAEIDALVDNDSYLLGTCKRRLLELHDIAQPAGECRGDLVRDKLEEYRIEDEKQREEETELLRRENEEVEREIERMKKE